MFYPWVDRNQNDDLIKNSAKCCDCEFCEYCEKHQLECENFQISSFFEQRIDRKFEQKQQTSSNSSITPITPMKNVISFLNTLNCNYSSLQQQIRKRQQQEKLKQRRRFVEQDNNFNIMKGLKDENNFAHNLQQFITIYK